MLCGNQFDNKFHIKKNKVMMLIRMFIREYFFFLPSIPSVISLLKIVNEGLLGGSVGVKHLALAQVVISQFVGSSSASGSVLTAQSLDTALNSVSPSLSATPILTLCFSFKNKYLKKKLLKLKSIYLFII